MYQKDALVMARYSSAGLFTYGTHSERRTTRVWLAFARDKKLGITWCHASVFTFMGTWKACSRWVRSNVAKGAGQDRL